MACDDVLITKVEYQERPNAEELKQSIYDASTITDTMLTNLFSSQATSEKQFNELFGDKDPIIPYKSVKDKTRSLEYYDDSNMPFGPKVGELTDGTDVRDVTIALSHLISAQKSEEDLIRKYNLKPNQEALVRDPNDNTRVQTSYSNMARTIGRDILKTRGYRLVPRSERGIVQATNYEIKVGEKALQKLIERNVVNVNESGHIVNRQFKDVSPENMNDTSYIKGKTYKPVISNIKTISLKPILHESKGTDTKLTEDQSFENYQWMTKLSAVKSLINPPNRAVPHNVSQDINRQAQDMNLMEKHEEILQHVQDNPLALTPFMKEALTDLKKEIDRSSKDTIKSTLQGLAEYIGSTKSSPHLFGTLDTKELNAIMMGDPVGLEQNYGRSQSKTIQFSRIIDDWDNLQDNLFYTYQTANQNRAHVLEQTLSYQSDNFLSRHVLGSSKQQELFAPEDIQYMIAYISDETGIEPSDILGFTQNELLNTYIDYLDNKEKNKDSALGIVATLANNLDKGKSPFNKPSKSAWEMMSYVQAIKDIRDGVNGDGTVKTYFMPKPDATASGAVITILQAARYGDEAANVTQQLQDGKRDGKHFTDAYQLATDVLAENIKTIPEYKGGDALKLAKVETYTLINKLIDSKMGIVSGHRDLIKLPFTKFIYGQSAKNNSIEISKEMASLIIESENKVLAQELLGDKYSEDTITLRANLVEKLSEKGGVAQELVGIVDETTGKTLFDRQAQELGDIHELLEEARFSQESTYNQIKILPPLAWINSEKNLANDVNYELLRDNQYDEKGKLISNGKATVIEKYFEAVLADNEGSFTTIKKRYPNIGSIKVLLQHMTDAAIMYESLGDMFNKPEFTNYFDGLMLNHDAIGATVSFARQLEPVYKENIMKVNSNYDFIEAAIAELKYAKNRTTNPDLVKRMEDKIAEFEALLPEQIAKKKEILSRKSIDTAFGIKTTALDKVNELYKGPSETTLATNRVTQLEQLGVNPKDIAVLQEIAQEGCK